MIVETFPVGMLQCNCTILGDETTREAMVIDPGDDADLILAKLRSHGLTLKQIVCTHAHIDHVGAIFDLQQQAETSASIHKADLFLFESIETQAEWLGIAPPKRGTIDRFLNDGSSVGCHGVELGVIHTPGHTPGSTCFLLSTGKNILFAGDTLFRNSIGRTDLWGGSTPDILSSIHNKLLTLEDDTLVIAGHGPSTTVGLERQTNPFLR
ncbi:MAG TPA: MBL fold metallo-hydrolase [Terriglobia bacterium]|nr:MBL fold metallo-hydrolase [Terriglobia bacterium]